MFLEVTRLRNPQLIEAALALHQDGTLPPNCYVIDLDSVVENAERLHNSALKHGLSLYFTTKQIGFNPLIAKSVCQAGISKAIAIDVQEAHTLARHGIPIGHIGHLVQIPTRLIGACLALEPEVVTVFSVEKARQISMAAQRAGRHVRLLLRVISEDDFFYPGQAGGLYLEDLPQAAASIQSFPNVSIAGVTSFPCLQYDEQSGGLKPTTNFYTLLLAAQILQTGLGIRLEQINAPGNTCCGSLEMLARMGATHGEAGHALTGTTYLHVQPEQAERPAVVYVSEISHLDRERAYIFGGGIYRRARLHLALVVLRSGERVTTNIHPLDPTAIDYYLALSHPAGHVVNIGDTVLLAARMQIFVSRSYVAVVKGIQSGQPACLGLYDSIGNEIQHFLGTR